MAEDARLENLNAALRPRYEIQQEIGRGGMATVYEAWDTHLERRVAIKVLKPDIAHGGGADRFLREIKITGQLSHPHILKLHDSGTANGFLYYVMPRVDGESLRALLTRRKQLPIAEALRITREVAGALTAAHSQGIVHRDVKPENILMEAGQALVSDFGIARGFSEAGWESLTATGVGIGTPGYMSPEQAAGERDVDGRSDVYSLGCLLYEMLVGEPPFTGPTAQAIFAKQMNLPPPHARTVRETVPRTLDTSLQRSLAKVPADRHQTVTEFDEELSAIEQSDPVRFEPAPTPRGWKISLVAGATVLSVVGLLLVTRFVGWPRGPQLDPNKVIVFPPAATEPALNDVGVGWNVALAIGGAVEHAQPLKFLDGWRYLPESMRSNPLLITPEVEERISRERGARYYTAGVIRSDSTSLSVVLRLQDVHGDSLVAQETATGTADQPPQMLGIEAITRLLPRIVEPDRNIPHMLEPYTDRHAGAILLSIQGDRQYRNSRFSAALDFYRRAIGEDSLLAFAAVKGAQAASWERRYDEAAELIAVAAAHDTLLPPKYQYFVRGWRWYLEGNADSAIGALTSSLDVDADWSEASMALGEVYFHLFPSTISFGTLSQTAFGDALAGDSTFVPALFHLGEIAIRDDDDDRAEQLIQRIARAEPDSSWLRHLTTMRDCIAAGADSYDWQSALQADPLGALLSAKSLSVGETHFPCAEAGFRAVVGYAEASSGVRWGGVMGLQSVLLAERRYDEALSLLDSAREDGSSGVYALYVFDAIAGAPFQARAGDAEAIARRFTGEYYSTAQPATRWLLGIWSILQGDTNRVDGIIDELRQSGIDGGQGATGRIADILESHRLAARGDRQAALTRLAATVPATPAGSIMWDVTGALAAERALQSELLFAAQQYAEAERVAAVFDHQEPISFLPYLPRSLLVRLRAASELGRRAAVAEYRERLVRLGWADSVSAALDR